MGIIQRQAVKTSIINWSGVLLGILNVMLIVPHVLETYGIYTFIMGVVGLAIPVVSLGFQLGVVKFFNEYDDGQRSNRSFLAISMVGIFLGFLLFSLVILLFNKQIVGYYEVREPERYVYLVFVIPLVLIFALISVLSSYISNFKRIVVPALLRNVMKLALPIFLILHLYKYIDVWELFSIIVGLNAIIVIAFFGYLNRLGELDWRWTKSIYSGERKSSMGKYLINGVFLSMGSVIAASIDAVMIGSMIEIGTTTAIYSIGVVIASILILPNSALAAITSPLIAEYWAKVDMKSLTVLYKKASINLIIIGLLFFVGIWSNLDDVFALMKNGEVISAAKPIVLYLGIARLFSMACGVNGLTLQMSPNYIVGTYSIVFLAGVNIITNYFFIKSQGLEGAAIATAISIFLYNLSIIVYLYFKYKLQPFSLKILVAIGFAIVAYFCGQLISFSNPLINIIVKSIVIAISYGCLVYFSKLSKDVNDAIQYWIGKIRFSD